jgi:outer membrane protein assembly factor BamB
MQSFVRTICLVVLLMPPVAAEEEWPGWRGPAQNLLVNGTGFPTHWNRNENIVWKVAVPGWGTSTPAVSGDQIFVNFCDEERNGVVCFDRAGQQQWLTRLGKAVANRNQKASGANPSPVTDGEHVFAYFRSGEVACLDTAGSVVWQVNTQERYGPDALWWDLGTSPVLTENLVVIAVMHQGPSYVVALDKKSGEEAWKADRNVEAPGEARDSYTTPIVVDRDGRETVIVLGADHVTAYDATNGQEIWRVAGLNPRRQGNFRSIASPLVMGDFLYAPYCRGETLTAIRLGGSGDVTDTHVVWRIESTASDVPSPVGDGQRLYLCSDRGDVSCLEAATGKEIWTERLPRNRFPFSSSPVLADGKLYCTREDGTTFVVQVGEQPKLLSTNELDEFTYATPVFVDGRILMRTAEFLFCIGEQ